MVFKVKQRGKNNYNNVTKKSERGSGFSFTSNSELAQFTSAPDKELDYSYNWPYDFFSLVELAQLETSFVFSPAQITTNVSGVPDVATNQGLPASQQGPPSQTTVNIDDAELTPF